MLAYDYPILGLFWTMLILFVWIAWFVIFFQVVIDIFRSHDIGGVAKTIWFVVVVFIPLLGVLIYVIARGDGMRDREMKRSQDQQAAMNEHVRQAAGSSTTATDELTKLSELKSSGVITDEEFATQKAKLLA